MKEGSHVPPAHEMPQYQTDRRGIRHARREAGEQTLSAWACSVLLHAAAPTPVELVILAEVLALRSGHSQVDAAVAQRLASLKGIPVARNSRRIVPISRSQNAFACGLRSGVFSRVVSARDVHL
jgi:hypothetical protein